MFLIFKYKGKAACAYLQGYINGSCLAALARMLNQPYKAFENKKTKNYICGRMLNFKPRQSLNYTPVS